MANDNGCFYRYAAISFGNCEGLVTHRDRYGNLFCRKHWEIVRKEDYPDADEVEKEIMRKVKRMVGYDPVGMSDLLHILVHPDVVEDTKRYIRARRV